MDDSQLSSKRKLAVGDEQCSKAHLGLLPHAVCSVLEIDENAHRCLLQRLTIFEKANTVLEMIMTTHYIQTMTSISPSLDRGESQRVCHIAERSSSIGRPTLSEAMIVLNSLPDSIKGCLLEAARLCGCSADIAQKNLLHHWHLKACPSNGCGKIPNIHASCTSPRPKERTFSPLCIMQIDHRAIHCLLPCRRTCNPFLDLLLPRCCTGRTAQL